MELCSVLCGSLDGRGLGECGSMYMEGWVPSLFTWNHHSVFVNRLWVCASVLSPVRLYVTSWTAAHQAPMSVEFSRQEYWSGLPFSFPGDLPNPGIKPTSPASPGLVGRFFTTEPPGKPSCLLSFHLLFNFKCKNSNENILNRFLSFWNIEESFS